LWWREIVVGMEDLVYITPPGMVSQILEQTQALNFAMGSEALTGALLKTLAASKPGARVLELGTGTGLATAWLLDGMDDASRIISIGTDLQGQEVARRFLGLRSSLESGPAHAQTLAGPSSLCFDPLFCRIETSLLSH
jgi:predicted O-methyltransferase YrrM